MTPIDTDGSATSLSSVDAFPSVNLSAKNWNILLMAVVVKRMNTVFMSQDESWLVMFTE